VDASRLTGEIAMNRALVTGGTGFLGSNVARLLAGQGVDVRVTDISRHRAIPGRSVEGVPVLHMDVTDRASVERVVGEFRPDVVFHFAGQAFVQPSWADPAETYRVNVIGTLHLLEALRRRAGRTALAFAGSGTEYGAPEEVPTPESAPLRPGTPYASSKTAADLLCLQYFLGVGVPVYRYRIFGTTGPGKTGDACNDFARQIADAERSGRPGTLRVGNLDPRRDIADVRDAARAMLRVVERGVPGEAYNIARGQAVQVRELVDALVGMARVPIEVVEEATRRRPVDEPVHLADVSRLRALGFAPEHELTGTLRDILDSWRNLSPSAAVAVSASHVPAGRSAS
jgi:GDP-4-dehydro-6-deoxy-D-mannose reductase